MMQEVLIKGTYLNGPHSSEGEVLSKSKVSKDQITQPVFKNTVPHNYFFTTPESAGFLELNFHNH